MYDEGEDESKKVYTERLAELRKVGDPVVERQIESMNRPAAFDALGRTIVHYEKIVAAYDSGVRSHTYARTHTHATCVHNVLSKLCVKWCPTCTFSC